ncbi:hypothetical protein SIO70_20155 [Chitinophaga sancti]|uniref:hypothetical protein n=1 Tax=Chitinophaga sancti TaxID=1004 RepID=UPI002A752B65|nr:hypothetical protein [Chitinophaga sancti]WPQ60668.1 hypothetical protein SIO70_20155 [Chitinophaga sancti]
MTQSLNKALIVFDYYTNTATFAENCENKARPSMHCNGKCQMMKKLKQEENKENKAPEKRSENSSELVVSTFPSIQLNNPAFIIISDKYFFDNDITIVEMPRSHFHPPSC